MKEISRYDDPKDLDQLMKNARRLGRDDVYWQAFRRRCELEGLDQDDSLHREFYQTLQAYEQLLSEKNGRKTRANRTWQKLSRKTVEECLEDWALADQETPGFKLLVSNNLVRLTGEYLVVKYSDRFSRKAVEAATQRLQKVEFQDKLRRDLEKALKEVGLDFTAPDV